MIIAIPNCTLWQLAVQPDRHAGCLFFTARRERSLQIADTMGSINLLFSLCMAPKNQVHRAYLFGLLLMTE